MLIAVWSPKGGSGTTVVAASLAVLLARERGGDGSVVADLEGDVPVALGVADPAPGRGLRQWLAAGSDVGVDALRRLAIDVGGGLLLLPTGAARGEPGGDPPAGDGRADDLVTALMAFGPPVVADCGTLGDDAEIAVAAGASLSLAVLRPCYLALRRALHAPVRPSGVVLVTERDRSLGRGDVEHVLGVPVRAEIEVSATVARAVDAGLLATRLPAALSRALRAAA